MKRCAQWNPIGRWKRFLCCGNIVRGLVSYAVLERANGKLDAADGDVPAQPSPDSNAALRS
jgi:hypothetical protein